MRGMWAAAIGAMAVAAAAAVVTQGPPAPRQVRLTLGEGTSMAAALSPDGRTMAIDLLGALWTYAAAGGPARRILEDGYDARLPVWSPDGRRLAFQAYHRDTWHVWIVEADGGGLQQVTFGPFDDREPYWSPDGTRLAFSSDRSGNYDIWIATLASGEVTRLTTGPANESCRRGRPTAARSPSSPTASRAGFTPSRWVAAPSGGWSRTRARWPHRPGRPTGTRWPTRRSTARSRG